MKVNAYLFTLLTLAVGSYAVTPLFTTCAGIGALQSGLLVGLVPSLVGILDNLIQQSLLGGECIDTCTQRGDKYAVFAQGIDLFTNPGSPGLLGNLLGSCFCTNTQIPSAQFIEGADPQGDCSSTIANLIGAKVSYLIPNEMQFQGCTATKPAGSGAASAVANIEECQSKCGGPNFAFQITGNEGCGLLGGVLGLLLGGRTTTYQCACLGAAGPPTSGYSTNCNKDTSTDTCGLLGLTRRDVTTAWNVYGTATDPSGITRRRIQYKRDSTPEEKFCPHPLQPCHVSSSQNGFECVDTTSELESCGGCPFGDYIRNITAGTDCTSIPGVAVGGVSCVSGQCQVSKCRLGWEMYNGRCVRKVNLSNARRVVNDY